MELKELTLATDNNVTSSVHAPMNLQFDAKPVRHTILGFIKINQDILNNPDLSSEQRNELLKLGNELNNLGYQGDESKIKIQLLDIFNKLN